MSILTVNGDELFYKESGSGPPILLIHGTSIDSDTWGETFDDLVADHRVVAYDRRGHSRSRGAAATYDWRVHTRDAVAFLEGLELGPATVVGWSAGGIVGMHVAAKRPDLVSSLVLAEVPYDVLHNLTPMYALEFLLGQVLIRTGRLDAGYERFMMLAGWRRGMVNTWEDPAFSPERAAACRANRGAWAVEVSPDSRHTMPTPEDAKRIAAPTTVVLGELSNPWFAKTARSLAAAVPGARLETIPNANHAFGFTAPKELAAVIRGAVPAAVPAV